MRLPHKGGAEMEVDYAGMTLPIINPETGEISQAQVFVAVLPANSYIYAEIQPSQELRRWLGGHVRSKTQGRFSTRAEHMCRHGDACPSSFCVECRWQLVSAGSGKDRTAHSRLL